MKRSLSVLLLAGASLFAMAAHAAPVFMLQFGSFESREEADEKLKALKTKHAGVLSRMEAGVREVTLPPDNLTVYRTQAGPLATRADAQSVCSQLASNGDDCYVVETAMMQPMTPPTQQVAETAPAPMMDMKPAPVAEAKPAPAPVVTMEEPQAAPAPMPVAAAAKPVPPVTPSYVSARDPQNIAAMNRVAAAPIVMAPDPQADAMQQELAQAVEKQQNPEALAVAEVKAQPKPVVKDRSLWDRIFGDDEEATPAKPVKVASPDDAVQAVPVEPMIVTNAAPTPMMAPPAPAPEPVAVTPSFASAPDAPTPPGAATDKTTILPNTVMEPAPSNVAATPMPSPVMAPPTAPVAMQPQPAPVPQVVMQAQPFPLPPPPAPLTGMSRPAPITVTPAVPAPMPVSAQPNMPAPVMAAPQPTGMVPANVRVEEAKRVPLTQTTTPPAPNFPPPAPAMMAPVAPALPQALSPSATIGQKTLWAQVGSFPDQQSALAFWDAYRRSHPDFPVVRVRVTTPLMAQQRGMALVNLRVGPFAREGFITNLCGSMVQEGLQCGVITDMGVAAGAGAPRGLLPGSRYGR